MCLLWPVESMTTSPATIGVEWSSEWLLLGPVALCSGSALLRVMLMMRSLDGRSHCCPPRTVQSWPGGLQGKARLLVLCAVVSSVVAQGQLCAVGGNDGPSADSHLSSAECFNGTSWTGLPNMGSVRTHHGVAVYEGQLCAVGGAQSLLDSTSLSSAECFDGSSWTELPNMGSVRRYVGVAVYRGQLCAVGGYDGSSRWSSAECFDGASWTRLPNMGRDRSGLGVAVFTGQLYALGGTDSSRLSSAEYFNGATWTDLPNMKLDRGNLGVAVYRGQLCAVGGGDGTNQWSSVECFDGASWTGLPDMKSARSGLGVTVYATSGPTSTITAPSVTPTNIPSATNTANVPSATTIAPSMAPTRPSIIINQSCQAWTPAFHAHPGARTRPQSTTYLSARRRARSQLVAWGGAL